MFGKLLSYEQTNQLITLHYEEKDDTSCTHT